MEKRSTNIKIGGISYTVSGYEPEEYMQKVGVFVDKKMNEIKSNCFALDTTMAAILTAVNIADENFKLYEQNQDLQDQVNQLNKRLAESEKPVSTPKRKRTAPTKK